MLGQIVIVKHEHSAIRGSGCLQTVDLTSPHVIFDIELLRFSPAHKVSTQSVQRAGMMTWACEAAETNSCRASARHSQGVLVSSRQKHCGVESRRFCEESCTY